MTEERPGKTSSQPLARSSSFAQWIADDVRPEEPPDPEALADRDRRMALGETRDLTGRWMGDPPAGRSALDQKREAKPAVTLAERVEPIGEEDGDV